MRILTTIDTIWLNVVLRASPNRTSQISYDAVASLLRMLADLAVLFSFPSIATEYNGPLEAAYAHIDDDRYDMVECGSAGQPKSDISDQLRRCSIPSTDAS